MQLLPDLHPLFTNHFLPRSNWRRTDHRCLLFPTTLWLLLLQLCLMNQCNSKDSIFCFPRHSDTSNRCSITFVLFFDNHFERSKLRLVQLFGTIVEDKKTSLDCGGWMASALDVRWLIVLCYFVTVFNLKTHYTANMKFRFNLNNRKPLYVLFFQTKWQVPPFSEQTDHTNVTFKKCHHEERTKNQRLDTIHNQS